MVRGRREAHRGGAKGGGGRERLREEDGEGGRGIGIWMEGRRKRGRNGKREEGRGKEEG